MVAPCHWRECRVEDGTNKLLCYGGLAQTVKRLPTMWETRVRPLGGGDPLEKEMATHSSTLAWKIPREKPWGRTQLRDFTSLMGV